MNYFCMKIKITKYLFEKTDKNKSSFIFNSLSSKKYFKLKISFYFIIKLRLDENIISILSLLSRLYYIIP